MHSSLLTVVTLGWGVHAAGTPFADQVKVEGGTIKGAVADGVLSFKGIPFAAPPQGDLRWRPPQPVVAWTGVRPATEYGHDCMQKPFGGDAAPLGTEPAEDCLVVNVWRPAGKERREAARDGLDLRRRLRQRRLLSGGLRRQPVCEARHRLRELQLPARDASASSRTRRSALKARADRLGNYAFMDAIAAMTWVKNNAARVWRHDPANVTAFGESAGGMMMHMLLTSPAAKGLVHKAIIEVGRRPQRHLPGAQGARGHAERSDVG